MTQSVGFCMVTILTALIGLRISPAISVLRLDAVLKSTEDRVSLWSYGFTECDAGICGFPGNDPARQILLAHGPVQWNRFPVCQCTTCLNDFDHGFRDLELTEQLLGGWHQCVQGSAMHRGCACSPT